MNDRDSHCLEGGTISVRGSSFSAIVELRNSTIIGSRTDQYGGAALSLGGLGTLKAYNVTVSHCVSSAGTAAAAAAGLRLYSIARCTERWGWSCAQTLALMCCTPMEGCLSLLMFSWWAMGRQSTPANRRASMTSSWRPSKALHSLA